MTWAEKVHQSRFDFGPLADSLGELGIRPLVKGLSEMFGAARQYPAHLDRLSGDYEGKGMLRMPYFGTENVQMSVRELVDLWQARPAHVVGIDFSNFQMQGFAFLSRMQGIEWIYFNNSSLNQADLKTLGGLRTPRRVFIDNTGVTSLAPLSPLNLEMLSAENTKIDSVAALAGQAGLKKLFISDTKVSDLAPLSGNSSLQTLSVARTAVTNFAPLAGCPNLTTLFVSEEALKNPTLMALQQGNPQIKVMAV